MTEMAVAVPCQSPLTRFQIVYPKDYFIFSNLYNNFTITSKICMRILYTPSSSYCRQYCHGQLEIVFFLVTCFIFNTVPSSTSTQNSEVTRFLACKCYHRIRSLITLFCFQAIILSQSIDSTNQIQYINILTKVSIRTDATFWPYFYGNIIYIHSWDGSFK